MLDVVKGIAGETVIELTQEEKGIIERYGSDKKKYLLVGQGPYRDPNASTL